MTEPDLNTKLVLPCPCRGKTYHDIINHTISCVDTKAYMKINTHMELFIEKTAKEKGRTDGGKEV